MTRILSATVLPDPPTDIDFIVIHAGEPALDWRDREYLAYQRNTQAAERLCQDLNQFDAW